MKGQKEAYVLIIYYLYNYRQTLKTMVTEVVKRLLNVDEYYKMAKVGILKPEDRVELIKGEIFEMSPIGSRHAAIVKRLARLLNILYEGQAVIGVQDPVRIDENNEPEPDISILKYRSDDYLSSHPKPTDVLVIIEVAGSSIRFDQEVKTSLYASCGIPVYWIINLENNHIEVYAKPKEGNYEETKICGTNEEVKLMGKKLSVNDLIILS